MLGSKNWGVFYLQMQLIMKSKSS